MFKLRQDGFTIVEALLVVIALTLVAGVGYYVYNSQTEDDTSTQTTTQKTGDTSQKEVVKDPTADWKEYKDPKARYSFKYPAAWVFAERLDLCDTNLVLLGADKNSVGICGSENGGQMAFSALDGDQRASYQLGKESYPDVITDNVSINDVDGIKQSGTYQPNDSFGIGPEPGEKQLIYIFLKNDKTFVARYTIKKTNPYPDVQIDFETLVLKTWKF